VGNLIELHRAGAVVADIKLSNMGTSALLIMLVLSGTALARTDAEKNLIVFLAEHDQTYRGLGMVGFSLNEMPWDLDAFDDQIRFMIGVIDGTLARTNWDKVEKFTPQISFYDPLLVQMKGMFSELRADDVEIATEVDEWLSPDEYLICDKHHVLKYEFADGHECIVCNW
jgi:hypothetical protein